MSYDAPPLQSDLSPEQGQVARATKLELPPELRRKLNASLPPGYRVAVIYPPFDQRPRVVIEKLPRSNSGWPARRPVFIPLESFAAVRAQPAPKNTRRKTVKRAEQTFAQAVKVCVSDARENFAKKLAAKARRIASLFGRLFAVGTVEAVA